MGSYVTHNKLVSTAITKYNNMIKQFFLKQVEPKDATIVALTTQITNLEKNINAGVSSSATKHTKNPATKTNRKNKHILEDWYIYFNEKEEVVKCENWLWCSHHKIEGVHDGMYVN